MNRNCPNPEGGCYRVGCCIDRGHTFGTEETMCGESESSIRVRSCTFVSIRGWIYFFRLRVAYPGSTR